MFNNYELILIRDALCQQYTLEFNKRQQAGLSSDIIEAQLKGLQAVLIKANVVYAE
jgi:hypothetical protein